MHTIPAVLAFLAVAGAATAAPVIGGGAGLMLGAQVAGGESNDTRVPQENASPALAEAIANKT